MATMRLRSLRTFRNAVLFAVGVMLVVVLADQGQASAGTARGCLVRLAETDGSTNTCGGTSGGTTIVAPTVAQVSPQDWATGVPRNANVKVTFSEEMDPNTVNGSTFQLHTFDSLFLGGGLYYTQQIPATISKDPTDATGRTFLLDPYGATSTTLLSANRKYRVTVTTGVRDLEDEFLPPSDKVWYFTTGSS